MTSVVTKSNGSVESLSDNNNDSDDEYGDINYSDDSIDDINLDELDDVLPPTQLIGKIEGFKDEISSSLNNPYNIKITNELIVKVPENNYSDDEGIIGSRYNDYMLIGDKLNENKSNNPILGRGAFAVVYRSRNLKNDMQCAIKLMYKKSLNKKMIMKSSINSSGTPQINRCSVLDLVQSEIEIMLSFNKESCHKYNIIKLLEVIDDPNDDRLLIILEYSSLGQIMYWNGRNLIYIPNNHLINLTKINKNKNNKLAPIVIESIASFHLEKENEEKKEYKENINSDSDNDSNINNIKYYRFHEYWARKYLSCLVEAVLFLHKNNIIHRDLKPDNLLLFGNSIIKLADFGTAERFSPKLDGTVSDTQGTSHFFSPGACSGKNRNGYLDDIWSIGCCFYIFLFGTVPYHKKQEHLLLEMIEKDDVILPNLHITKSCNHLLRKILERDENKRITLENIKKHPWYSVKE